MKRAETSFHNSKELHIVYASDDRFAEILGVSLTSLYENNQDMAQIHVYILDSRISEENKRRLESVCRFYKRSAIQWMPAKDISRELQIEIAVDRGSLSQYSRLFVASALPENLERALYLDCDVIIRKPLDELWNLDMQGRTIAALKDAFSRWYRMNIGLKSSDIMFNSGVMLIDLRRWKEQEVEKKLLEFIRFKGGRIQQGDQGALNAVLAYDVYCFEPRFNSVTIYYDFSYEEMLAYRKPPDFYLEEQVEEATENPVVLHFTTSFLSRRPWVEGCRHKYVDEWLKYKAMSPWKDSPLWKHRKAAGIRGMYTVLAAKLPRKLMIGISGMAQIYGRPFLYRMGKY